MYDWCMVALGFGAILYMVIMDANIANRAGDFLHANIRYDMTIAVIGILMLVVAIYRTLGLPLILVAAILAGYVFVGGGNWGGASFIKGTWHFWMQEEGVFGKPLAVASLQVTGFRIQSLPDVPVVEGDGLQVVFENLNDHVDQAGDSVIWSASFINGLNTAIDLDNRVTMSPGGIFGDTTVVFTAFEVNEGNSDADTVQVQILARPRITGLPPTVTFHFARSSGDAFCLPERFRFPPQVSPNSSEV